MTSKEKVKTVYRNAIHAMGTGTIYSSLRGLPISGRFSDERRAWANAWRQIEAARKRAEAQEGQVSKLWQPKEWWPMECDSLHELCVKVSSPPAGYELHSWFPRPPYEHLYVVMFRRKREEDAK